MKMSTHAATVHRVEVLPAKQFGVAWLMLCLALAIHVTDEALTNFLAVYNPTVIAIRSRLPYIPLPTFSFPVWLTGLVVAVVVLFGLSPFVFRGARIMVPLAYLFGIFMLANGLQHIGGSIYMHRLMPGVYSAPCLLATSIYLLISARNYRRKHA